MKATQGLACVARRRFFKIIITGAFYLGYAKSQNLKDVCEVGVQLVLPNKQTTVNVAILEQ